MPKCIPLSAMTTAAAGELLVISDSDIRADPALLSEIARDFEDPAVGVVTCPYRAVPGSSLWSRLEALGMNTEFWSGVLVAQFLAPMNFAVGPTMAVRKSCLDAIGGWDAFGDFLAEDFEVGRQARLAGYDVRLSTHAVEHRIGSQALRENLIHRLRWRRSTRRSRPVGYWGRSSPIRFPGRCCCRLRHRERLGRGQHWARVSPCGRRRRSWSGEACLATACRGGASGCSRCKTG